MAFLRPMFDLLSNCNPAQPSQSSKPFSPGTNVTKLFGHFLVFDSGRHGQTFPAIFSFPLSAAEFQPSISGL
jgi:hypothetical protein